jgi:hypothetical protein
MKCLTCVTEYDAASYTVKKRRTYFIFQITYLLPKRGWAIPSCSAAREILGLGCDDEVS